jgi:4-amino-4-deoxy-L-arabinose transferase-like glycosyltransferase
MKPTVTVTRQESSSPRFAALGSLAIFVAGMLTRLPLRVSYLINLDQVHFALAIHNYDVRQETPSPPGYILFVGLARLLRHFMYDDAATLTILASIFASASAVLMFLLALKLFADRRCAALSSATWLTNPILWYSSATGEIYPAGGFGSTASALAFYAFWERPSERLAILAGAVYAATCGLRQDQTLFLAPVCLLVFLWSRDTRRYSLFALGTFASVYLAWWLPMIKLYGGYAQYSALLRATSMAAAQRTSIFFGAGILEHAWMIAKLTGSIMVGLLPLPLLFMSKPFDHGNVPVARALTRAQRWFLIVWAAPFIIFYSLVHMTKPGYCLGCLPPLILLSSRFFSVRCAPGRHLWSGRFGLVLALSVALNTCFFFLAPQASEGNGAAGRSAVTLLVRHGLNRSVLLCTYSGINLGERVKAGYFGAIEAALADKPAALFLVQPEGGALVDWRMLMYYFPQLPVYGIWYTAPFRTALPGGLSHRLRGGFWHRFIYIPVNIRTEPSSEGARISLIGTHGALFMVSSNMPPGALVIPRSDSIRDLTPVIGGDTLFYKLLQVQHCSMEPIKVSSGDAAVEIH